MTATYLVGDVHGHADKLIRVLQEAELIGEDHRWTGETAKLWLLGDFFNRGPDGIGAVKLLMALQEQAKAAGGEVDSVLGNHDVITLAAYHFGEQVVPGSDKTFLEIWQENGGVRHDLKQMVGEQVEWLIHRPALALVEDNLLAHADACFYTDYGGSIDEVNWSFVTLLDHRDRSAWGQLINDFKEHQTFSSQKNGLDQLQSFLDRFGGRRFIHGHTPIFKFTGQAPETVRDPLIYARGLCINLDGGVYLGGPGFFFRLNSNNEGDKGETS